MPPKSTPVARATIGISKNPRSRSAERIMDKFKKTVEMAGVKKWRRVLRIPIQSATRLMKKMYGNIKRLSRTVNSNLPGTALNPGNMMPTMAGEKMMPAKAIPAMTMVSRVKQILASSLARSSPCWLSVSEKVGTKAEVSAPSAKKRRSMLGIWKAAMKASVASPAPNRRATTMSLTIPMMRDNVVALPRIPAARTMCFFSDIREFHPRYPQYPRSPAEPLPRRRAVPEHP